MRGRGNTHKRICRAHPRFQGLSLNVGFKPVAQESCVARVDLLQPITSGGGIHEGLGGYPFGCQYRCGHLQSACSFNGWRDWSSKSLRPAEMDQRRRPSQQRDTTQLE
jgi:hypothetical protein